MLLLQYISESLVTKLLYAMGFSLVVTVPELVHNSIRLRE